MNDDDAPVKLEKCENEATDAGLGSEDADVAGEKLVGRTIFGDTEPAKLGGDIGIVSLAKEDGAAGTEGLLGGLGTLCIFAGEDLPS